MVTAGRCPRGLDARVAGVAPGASDGTVSFHNFKSHYFKLSVSNPKSKYVAYLSVLSQISNCQGLGRKNKHEILKTDYIGKTDSIHHHLLEVTFETDPLPELRQYPLYTTHSGWWWCIESVFRGIVQSSLVDHTT